MFIFSVISPDGCRHVWEIEEESPWLYTSSCSKALAHSVCVCVNEASGLISLKYVLFYRISHVFNLLHWSIVVIPKKEKLSCKNKQQSYTWKTIHCNTTWKDVHIIYTVKIWKWVSETTSNFQHISTCSKKRSEVKFQCFKWSNPGKQNMYDVTDVPFFISLAESCFSTSAFRNVHFLLDLYSAGPKKIHFSFLPADYESFPLWYACTLHCFTPCCSFSLFKCHVQQFIQKFFE